MSDRKATAREILDAFDEAFHTSAEGKYTEAKIKQFLDEAGATVKKLNQKGFFILEKKIKGLSRKEKGFAVIIKRLSHTLSKSLRVASGNINNNTYKMLLCFYLAFFHPEELHAKIDLLSAYRRVKNKKPGENINLTETPFSTFQYLVYFWNHIIKNIEIGLIQLHVKKINDKDIEWTKGSLYYFSRDKLSSKITKWKQLGPYRPLKVSQKNTELDTITILSGNQKDSNFLTESDEVFFSSYRVLIKDKLVEDRKVMMCSYSVAIEKGSKPTAGIGILARVGEENAIGPFPLINKAGLNESCLISVNGKALTIEHTIPDEITNLLFDRRDSLRDVSSDHGESKVFESFAELPNIPYMEAIKEIAGIYLGYHLQNDYAKLASADQFERGALRTFILEIQPSGICYLLDDEETAKVRKAYFGFLSMKHYQHKKMLINVDREKDKYGEYHSWRLQFYLELVQHNVLEGVVAGFSKTNYKPIASPVRFKKAGNVTSLDAFMKLPISEYPVKKIFPSTFFKAEYPLIPHHIDLDLLLNWDEGAIPYFTSIYKNYYFNSPHHSLPHNFINIDFGLYNQYKNLIGNYYLISCSHSSRELCFSKVKVQLRNYGEAFFIYPLTNKNKTFDLFTGRWEMHENGDLLKIRLKFRKRSTNELNILMKNHPRSFGDFIFQLNQQERIEDIDFLNCISVWVNYEKDNTVIAKKEFLFPASDLSGDTSFPQNFTTYYEYKFNDAELNEELFFSGIRYFESPDESVNQKRKANFLAFMRDSSAKIIMTSKQIFL